MNENLKKWLPWVMILLFIAVAFGPRWISNAAAAQFGKPLFEYPMPADSVLISKDAVKDEDGGMTAALLLQTQMTSEELEAFYEDLDCPPAKEGQTVTLDAKPLSDADLDVLKTAKLYVEGEQYQFVYVYSK